MTFLSAAQRSAAQALADLGAQINNRPPTQTISGLIPPLTLSNTKRAVEILRDLDALWENVRKGVAYSVAYYKHQALLTLDTENP
jgi:hypothetical protein